MGGSRSEGSLSSSREKAESVKEIGEFRAKAEEQSKEVDSVRRELASVRILACEMDRKIFILNCRKYRLEKE
uniref:Uncharacterized protein n=1 Tax=Leersia perrieri TaxID=77586 RepID=A0A0D9X5W9_9ORYZ